MARTRTLLVDIRKLHRQGEEGAVILSLMMACNDLATANDALNACNKNAVGNIDYIRRGAAMYYVRLQMAHLNEALKAVVAIREHPRLLNVVDCCPTDTAAQFKQLLSYAEGGAERGDFRKYVELVRHQVTFHYDRSQIRRAVAHRARRKGESAHFITLADDICRLRFQVADDLVDTLICHQIWGIEPSSDVRVEADRIADFGFRIFKTFLDFAGTFISVYVEKHATFT